MAPLYMFEVYSKYKDRGWVYGETEEDARNTLLEQEADEDTWDTTDLEFIDFDIDTLELTLVKDEE